MSFTPDTDGLDHVNVSSSGRTILGLLLDLSAYTPVDYPEFGRFASMEGLWVWLSTGRTQMVFRHLYGGSAFAALTESMVVLDPLRDSIIQQAWQAKFQQHPQLLELFCGSLLPFASYDCFASHPVGSERLRWALDRQAIVNHLSYYQEQLCPLLVQ